MTPEPGDTEPGVPAARTRHCSPAGSCCPLGRARRRAGRDRRPSGHTARRHPAPAPRGSCSRRRRGRGARGRSRPRPGAGRRRSCRRGCCTPGTPRPRRTACLQGWIWAVTEGSRPALPCTATHPHPINPINRNPSHPIPSPSHPHPHPHWASAAHGAFCHCSEKCVSPGGKSISSSSHAPSTHDNRARCLLIPSKH